MEFQYEVVIAVCVVGVCVLHGLLHGLRRSG